MANATIRYTHLAPVARDVGFTVPGEVAVNQYVFGDTVGEDTRAELLSSNDDALDARLTLAYACPAGRKASYVDQDGGGDWFYTFKRSGDQLWYRGLNVELQYGTAETMALEDYDDSAGIQYRVLDLRTVDGLLAGMQYTVLSEDGTLEWAVEMNGGNVMAVTAYWYGQALMKALNKEIDWDTDTIKVMLTTSSYSPNQDTDDYKDDVTNEVSGTGYTAGGATLGSKTIGYTAGTNVIKLDAADATWTSATITNARYAVIYDDSPVGDSAKPLLCYIDFGENVSCYAGTFTITFDAAGIATITVS